MNQNETNWFFNSCHEIKILVDFSWPALLKAKEMGINLLKSILVLLNLRPLGYKSIKLTVESTGPSASQQPTGSQIIRICMEI